MSHFFFVNPQTPGAESESKQTLPPSERERQTETESEKEEGNVRPNKLIIHNAFPAM